MVSCVFAGNTKPSTFPDFPIGALVAVSGGCKTNKKSCTMQLWDPLCCQSRREKSDARRTCALVMFVVELQPHKAIRSDEDYDGDRLNKSSEEEKDARHGDHGDVERGLCFLFWLS